MRPQSNASNLPKGVYWKHGAFWYVKDKRWRRLTDKQGDLATALAAIPGAPAPAMERVESFVARLVATTRCTSRSRRGGKGLEHTLTREDAMEMLARYRGRCAVTGLPFSLEKVGDGRQRPYAPSIDRIDSSLGYTKENCRIVCVAANFAMGSWGEGVLREMAQSMRRKLKVLDVQQTPPSIASIGAGSEGSHVVDHHMAEVR